MPDTLNEAVVKELLADATVSALCTHDPKITQENPYGHTLEGSGNLQLVVFQWGSWAQPTKRKTAHFPMLYVQCWADPTRDSDGNVVTPDAPKKARAALDAVSEVLHLVQGGVTWGDDFYVISSHRISEPFQMARPPTDDELVLFRTEFGVTHP